MCSNPLVRGSFVTTAILEPLPMSKDDKPKRNDKTVKIDRDLATRAGLIADTKGISMAEYLSEVLRPIIDRDWPKAVKAAGPRNPTESHRKPPKRRRTRDRFSVAVP